MSFKSGAGKQSYFIFVRLVARDGRLRQDLFQWGSVQAIDANGDLLPCRTSTETTMAGPARTCQVDARGSAGPVTVHLPFSYDGIDYLAEGFYEEPEPSRGLRQTSLTIRRAP